MSLQKNFYILVVKMLNTNFLRNKPIEKKHRDYKYFDEFSFKVDL